MYENRNSVNTFWVHVDNYKEIAVFRTKYEYVDISLNLLNWKTLNSFPQNYEKPENIKYFLNLNGNESIAISDNGIINTISNTINGQN